MEEAGKEEEAGKLLRWRKLGKRREMGSYCDRGPRESMGNRAGQDIQNLFQLGVGTTVLNGLSQNNPSCSHPLAGSR